MLRLIKSLHQIRHLPRPLLWGLMFINMLGGAVFMGLPLGNFSERLAIANEPAPVAPDVNDPQVINHWMNKLVGEWKGVAMPKRGSNAGAWQETCEWIWEFNDQKDPIGVRYKVSGSQLVQSGLLTFDATQKIWKLTVQLDAEHQREYNGKIEQNYLLLEAPGKPEEEGYRLKITPLSDVRLLVLHEKRLPGRLDYGRVVEVGYTRKGVRLAQEGVNGPICIVTGGEGNQAITYQGKTYYVCCSGCKSAFEDNPEKFIKLAQERAAAKNAK